jgi:hypothetical protein
VDQIEESYQRPVLSLPRKDDRRFSGDTPPAQQDEVHRKSCSSPDGVLDELFDHLSVGFHGFPGGSTDLRKSRNRLSKGLHWWPWETKGTYMS